MKNLAKIETFVATQLSNHVTTTDIIAVLSIMHSDNFPTKSSAREWLETYMIDNNLVPSKKITKSGALKEWVLNQENPTEITMDQIKEKCIELDMKGGSIQYYINAYSLAFELVSKIK